MTRPTNPQTTEVTPAEATPEPVREQVQERPPLPTIWEVPDPLWDLLQKVLAVYDPPNKLGRPRIDARRALNGILYRLRTGCQWNHLPKHFGDDASIHRTLERWERLGIFDILWALLLTKAEGLAGVDWHWQAVDGGLGKARGVPGSGVSKKGHRSNASVLTPPIGPKRASRRACLSKVTAGRLLSV